MHGVAAQSAHDGGDDGGDGNDDHDSCGLDWSEFQVQNLQQGEGIGEELSAGQC